MQKTTNKATENGTKRIMFDRIRCAGVVTEAVATDAVTEAVATEAVATDAVKIIPRL